LRFLLPYIIVISLSAALQAQDTRFSLSTNELPSGLQKQLIRIVEIASDSTALRSELIKKLSSEGYLNAEIRFEIQKNLVLVQAGCLFRFGVIALNTDKGGSDFDPTDYLNKGFSESELQKLSEEIRSHYLDLGYAEAGIKIGQLQINKENCLLNVTYEIKEGERWVVTDLKFSPLKRVGPEYLKKRLGFRDSLLVNAEALANIQEELLLTGYFNEVSEPVLIRKEDQKQLYLAVEERNANYLDGIIGYVPNNFGGGSFIGEGKVGLINSIADGNALDVHYQRLTLDNTRLNVDVSQQWLGGLPLGLRGGFTLFQQDTNYQSRIFSIGAEYYLSPKATLYADYQSTGVTASESVLQNRSELDGSRAVTTVGFQFRNLNHPRVPTQGFSFDLSFGTGIKRVEPDAGIPLNSSRERTRQRILNSQIQTYFPLNLPHMLHFSGMLHLTTAQYFTEIDLMRFGGARSFRGYAEEQFFASRVGWFNSEYRYLLNRESFLFLFNTLGAYYRPQLVTEINSQFEQADFLYSFGFGLSYNTRAGQLMFSYAISPQDELANGKIHFGILTRL
jgi:outer membrane protein assembly factor BamA